MLAAGRKRNAQVLVGYQITKWMCVRAAEVGREGRTVDQYAKLWARLGHLVK